MNPPDRQRWVGPVLQAGPVANAVIAAIRAQNPRVEVIDRGSYVRVLAPEHCSVTRSSIENHAGHSFRFPSDLEAIMPSFKGKFELSEEHAAWHLETRGGNQ